MFQPNRKIALSMMLDSAADIMLYAPCGILLIMLQSIPYCRTLSNDSKGQVKEWRSGSNGGGWSRASAHGPVDGSIRPMTLFV